MNNFDIDTSGSAVVVYCRVSTEEQGDNGQSLDVQEKYCRDFCAHKQWNVVGVYKDSFTGRSWSRPQFMEMREAIEESYDSGEEPIKFVVVYDTSRFTRSGDLDKGKKKISPATLVIASTNMVVDGEDAATDIVTSIATTIDRHQVKVIREKTKASLNKKIEDGFHVSKPLTFAIYEDIKGFPIGLVKEERYVVYDKNHNMVERAPTEIRYLQELWDKADEGYSIRQLAKLWHVSRSAFLNYLQGGHPHALKEKGPDGKYHPIIVKDDNGNSVPLVVNPRYNIPPRIEVYIARYKDARSRGVFPPSMVEEALSDETSISSNGEGYPKEDKNEERPVSGDPSSSENPSF